MELLEINRVVFFRAFSTDMQPDMCKNKCLNPNGPETDILSKTLNLIFYENYTLFVKIFPFYSMREEIKTNN